MNEKRWFKSKMMILNGVATVAGVAGTAITVLADPSTSAMLGTFFPAAAPWLAVLGAINLALRSRSNTALTK